MLWTLFGALFLVVAYAGLTFLENHSGSRVTGSLKAHGSLGDFSFQPNNCSSGTPAGFFGAQLMRRDQRWRWYISGSEYKHPIVRLILDPARGRLVSVQLPGSKTAVAIDRAHCRRFQVDVHYTTGKQKGRLVDGSLDLDCDTLAGRVQFSDCY